MYDSKADLFIQFGGAIGPNTFTNSTWSYDYASNTWTNITPVVGPSPRAGLGMVYDSRADRVVLFGGFDPLARPVPLSRDTWAFDVANQTWTNRTSSPSPSPRELGVMVYDPVADRTILFGGFDGNNIRDTWSYEYAANRWTQKATAGPSARFLSSMVYDNRSNLAVLYGGGALVGAGYNWFSDTWVYDAGNDTWTNKNPSAHPRPGGVSGMAYHAATDLTILFGGGTILGSTNNFYNDTWAYDLGVNAWSNITPVVGPSPRWLPGMAYSGVAHRTILSGGVPSSFVPSAEAWSFEYVPSPPSAPRNLVATAGDSRVNLTWQVPALSGGLPITNYTIYRGNTPGGETPIATVGAVLTYVDMGLLNGFTYYYQVTAVNGVGEGPRSTEASATPVPPPPGPSEPRNLTALAGNAEVVLGWVAPASPGGPITAYTVYRGTSPGTETLLVTLGDISGYTDSGLTNGRTYYYQVTATNAGGEGPRSSEASATPMAPPVPPSAPLSVLATAGIARVDLSWQAPSAPGGSAISGYRIYRGTSPGTEVFLRAVGAVLTYTDSAVANGRAYYYQVSAVNGVGEGPRSAEVHATPVAPADTVRPSLAITSPGNNTVATSTAATVAGTASDNVAIEKVEVSTDGTTWTLATGKTSWSADLTLTAGSNTIYVRATDTSGNQRTHWIAVTVQPEGPGGGLLSPAVITVIVLVAAAALLGLLLALRRRRKRQEPSVPPPPPPPPPERP